MVKPQFFRLAMATEWLEKHGKTTLLTESPWVQLGSPRHFARLIEVEVHHLLRNKAGVEWRVYKSFRERHNNTL